MEGSVVHRTRARRARAWRRSCGFSSGRYNGLDVGALELRAHAVVELPNRPGAFRGVLGRHEPGQLDRALPEPTMRFDAEGHDLDIRVLLDFRVSSTWAAAAPRFAAVFERASMDAASAIVTSTWIGRGWLAG